MPVLLVLIYSAALFYAGYLFRKYAEVGMGIDSKAMRTSMIKKL